ncbi:hypothetical protein BV97_02345 [Novosphingobium resinovorum]|uniref:Uncharacterized protein n=1 Tax=Novosphingobium resinovorum TaxID=158500 RepID=A0A031JY12_9SPHN|nr:hypothetical protein BV97_02345 [Novosphingobium resinovorum]
MSGVGGRSGIPASFSPLSLSLSKAPRASRPQNRVRTDTVSLRGAPGA